MTNFLDIKPAEIAWIVALIGVLGYEMWAVLTHHATLSQAIWTATRAPYGPMIPFLLGLVCGHLFFSGN